MIWASRPCSSPGVISRKCPARSNCTPSKHVIGPGNALWRDPYAAGRPPVYDEADGQRVHEEVRALLHRVGETALISSVESSFADVRYFAVSALGHGPRGQQLSTAGASPLRVGDPVRWLLSASGWA